MEPADVWQRGCPVTIHATSPRIQLSHGEGGRDSRRLITDLIMTRLGISQEFQDAARMHCSSNRLAIATDSHTVSPLFFPGGDIGTLSVWGTANDLAVAGAVPTWMTVAIVMEEGLPVDVLALILDRMSAAARIADVQIIGGDTKVVPHGAIDGIMINTTGTGPLRDPIPPGPASICEGDLILVSGPIGLHGAAVMSAREELGFMSGPHSDCQCLFPGVRAVLDAAGAQVRCVRDATRGGVAAVLHEWGTVTPLAFQLEESAVPVPDDVRGVCEVLGIDPLHVANEGTFVAVVDAAAAPVALNALRARPAFADAAVIGTVVPRRLSPVTIQRRPGSIQALDEPSGAPLPRIC